MKVRSWVVLVRVTLVLLWQTAVAVSAQFAPSLFLEDAQPRISTRNNTSSQDAAPPRVLRVNPDVLQQLTNNEEISCRIALTTGEERVATMRKVETSDDRFRVVGGKFEGEAGSQLVLVTDGEYLAGSFQIAGRRSFRIVPKKRGVCEFNELEVPKLPLCGAVPGRTDAKSVQRRIPEDGSLKPPMAPANSDVREIEVMMVYTTGSRILAGDVGAMEAQARLSIEEANVALANSNAGVRFRVVHMAEVDYQGSGTLQSDLDQLAAPFDGVMDEVHVWRDWYQADLVCLVVERSDSGFEGLAHFATGAADGFSVITLPYLTGYYLVAHELGHNLGCDHDRENAVGAGAFSFSYGYRFDVDGVSYRTVMAYAPGSVLPYYSNPDISFQGVPTGVPAGSAGEADNARTIREMAAFVDSYRGIGVQLRQPLGGASFTANATIEISAVVGSDEGPVVGVQFFDGDLPIGLVATAPYRFSWRGAAPGRHDISARTGIVPGGEVRSPVVTIGVRPENDDFANRLPLSGTDAVGSAVLYAATSEAGEPASLQNAGVTAWWTWRAPENGAVRVSTSEAPTQQSAVALFSGATLEALQPIAVTRTSKSDLLFNARAGDDYQICLAGSPGSSPVSVHLTMQPASGTNDVSLNRAPLLLSPHLRGEQEIEFTISGSAGQTVSIESSSDLVRWEPVGQIYMRNADYSFSHPGSFVSAAKFFRVLVLQNGVAGSGE